MYYVLFLEIKINFSNNNALCVSFYSFLFYLTLLIFPQNMEHTIMNIYSVVYI